MKKRTYAALRWPSLASVAATAVAVVAACGGHPSSQATICVAGETEFCTCSGGPSGEETCSENGTYYEPCVCTSEDSGAEDDAGFDAQLGSDDGAESGTSDSSIDSSIDSSDFDSAPSCVVPIWATASNPFTGEATSP